MEILDTTGIVGGAGLIALGVLLDFVNVLAGANPIPSEFWPGYASGAEPVVPFVMHQAVILLGLVVLGAVAIAKLALGPPASTD
ncbi:MAG: hypothetical protein ACOCYZ_02995 [Halococcoides sp.]